MKHINFKRGQSILIVLIAGAVVAGAALAVPTIITTIAKQQKTMRVKKQVHQIESRLRLIFGDKANYDNCTGDPNLCDLKIAVRDEILAVAGTKMQKARFQPLVLGAVCPPLIQPCGLKVRFEAAVRPAFDKAEIYYEGTDLSLAPVIIEVKAPGYDAAVGVDCSDGFFAGYVGAVPPLVKKCIKPARRCEDGQVFVFNKVQSIGVCDANGICASPALGTCEWIHNSPIALCPPQTFITGINGWTKTLQPIGVSCQQARIDPSK